MNSPGENGLQWEMIGSARGKQTENSLICCCKGTQFLKSMGFQQPGPRAGKTQNLKAAEQDPELNIHSNKDEVKKELVFCLKGAEADLSKELDRKSVV